MENMVAQMLLASGHKIYFYSNPSREDYSSRMEIDLHVPHVIYTGDLKEKNGIVYLLIYMASLL